MYMCLKNIYIYTCGEQGLVVKTPKCLDLLPSGSEIIDLDFLNNLLSSNFFFYHKPYIVLFMCFKNFTFTVSHGKYPFKY